VKRVIVLRAAHELRRRRRGADIVIDAGGIGSVRSVDLPAGAGGLDQTLIPGLVNQVNDPRSSRCTQTTAGAARTIMRALPRPACTSVLLAMGAARRASYVALFDALDTSELGRRPEHGASRFISKDPASTKPGAVRQSEAVRRPDLDEACELLDRGGGRSKLLAIDAVGAAGRANRDALGAGVPGRPEDSLVDRPYGRLRESVGRSRVYATDRARIGAG